MPLELILLGMGWAPGICTAVRNPAELVWPAPPIPAAYPPGAGPLEPPVPPDPEPPDPVPEPDPDPDPPECDVAQAVKKSAIANRRTAEKILTDNCRDIRAKPSFASRTFRLRSKHLDEVLVWQVVENRCGGGFQPYWQGQYSSRRFLSRRDKADRTQSMAFNVTIAGRHSIFWRNVPIRVWAGAFAFCQFSGKLAYLG